MGSRLVVFGLVWVLGLGGSVTASPMGESVQEGEGPGDETRAASDTVFVARMPAIEIVAERGASGPSAETRVASAASSQKTGTAARTRPTEARQRGGASQPDGSPDRASARGVGVGGFVMNETFSVVGDDFYTAFYGAWSEPEEVGLYTVAVQEEPSPQFGARLAVHVDDTTIFRTFLRPNNRKIQDAAQRAAQRAHIYLKKYHEPREVY